MVHLRDHGPSLFASYPDIPENARDGSVAATPVGIYIIERMMKLVRTWAVSDYGSEVLQQLRVRYNVAIGEDFRKPFILFNNHPALCGLIKYHLMMQFHMQTTYQASCIHHITLAAHLYNSAHHTGYLLLKVKWEDMDQVIQRIGKEAIFAGKRPKQSFEFQARLRLAFGISIMAFSKQHLTGQNPGRPQRNDIRHLPYLSRSAELSSTRKSKHSEFCAQIDRKDNLVDMELLVRDFLEVQKRSSEVADSAVPKMKRAHVTLTALQTLKSFVRELEADEKWLNFNLLDLQERCNAHHQRIQDD